jgi:programmed cell death protein 5
MSELDDIRQAKLRELQGQLGQQQGQADEDEKLQQEIEALEAVIKTRLTKEALARYGSLKVAFPEKAVQLLVVLGQAMQKGQIRALITDEQLREILMKLTPPKKDFTITRK